MKQEIDERICYTVRNVNRSSGRKSILKNQKSLAKEAMRMLKKTSRTFYIPITMLDGKLKEAVAAAYLCMRAIDEIEDHEQLAVDVKERLLLETADILATPFDHERYKQLVQPYTDELPEVTLRLGDWIRFCPGEIVKTVQESTRTMAQGMAKWTRKNWKIQTEADLDEYTYYVAGLVGLMLSDLWKWHRDLDTDPELALGYGRGLQAVNILRNKDEDFQERGVNFFPEGWSRTEMFRYAERNLVLADEYMKDITNRRILLFCQIPLALAKRTLHALKSGREKISRDEVREIVGEITK